MSVLLLLPLFVACGSSPPVEVKLNPEIEKIAKEQVVDMSGIPVTLEGKVVSVEAAAGEGGPSATAAEAGVEIDVVVTNAPICAADGATVAAAREGVRITLTVTGGAVCAAGQVGKVALHTTDRPGNVRGAVVAVQFASGAPVEAPIVRADAASAPTPTPVPTP